MTVPQQRADEAIQEQREWLRVTLDSIGDAVVTTDTQGRVTFLNPVAQSLTGWSQESACGQPIEKVFRIVNEETRRTVENPAARALREGVVVGLANHTLLIAQDGTERPIDDSAAPIRNARGEVAGVVLVFRDISERRRQELLVQAALQYAEDIIATLREPFVVLDGSLHIRTANRSFYESFRATPAETVGCSIFDFGSRQWDIPHLRTLLATVLSNSHPIHDFPVEHDFPGLGRRYMLLNARRFHSSDHQPDLILLAIEDVTERRLAAEAQRLSEVRYRRLFESARDGVLILDVASGRITDANPFMGELLGRPVSELDGKELWEIGIVADRSASEAVVREVQQQGYVRYEHLPLEARGGKSVDVEVVANVYREDDHHSVIQCNIRDITERRRMEQLTHDQATALADLHRRKDEFLAMLSHELRNPLAPIANAVQLLRIQQSESELQREARMMIERQLTQLTRLVDELLEVSRITTGRIHLQQERLTLQGVVQNAVESVRPLLASRRHTFELQMPSELIWLEADSVRLQQVIVNLLTNAAKYTDEAGRIALVLERQGDQAVLRVRDSGLGIAPDVLPRIFDLFTQAERSLDRAQGGLGIGLCIVKRLVELHQGRVEAYSALGQGSEFVVRLPAPAMPPLVHAPEAAQPTGPRLRILVVEDNLDVARSYALLLKALEHDCKITHDGPSALAEAETFRPDLVLLDIGLPGMNGYEVARRMRQNPDLRQAVIVAVTGYAQDSDLQKALPANIDHYVTKPADFSLLQRIMATVPARET